MPIKYNFAEFIARSSDVEWEQTTLKKVLASLPPLDGAAWIGGGAVRRTILGQEPDSDFDFFFKNADALNKFCSALEGCGLTQVRETEHHRHFRGIPSALKTSVPIDVQCIRFSYYDDPADVIDSFDFTICQAATDGETLWAGDYTLFDLARKRLAVHKITFPLSSMRRVLKYTKQGFTACNGALATILKETATRPELMQTLNIAYVD